MQDIFIYAMSQNVAAAVEWSGAKSGVGIVRFVKDRKEKSR
jgi:hypothetical protein